MVPAAWLWDLAVRVKLYRSEWRLLALRLSTPGPLSARRAARVLKLSYPFTKRMVRELVAWRLLCRRAPGVLSFNPRAEEWGPPQRQQPVNADAPPGKARPAYATRSREMRGRLSTERQPLEGPEPAP